MNRNFVSTCATALVALLCAASAGAEAGSVELRTRAEKRLLVPRADGTAEEQFVPAGKVVPGDVVAYTIEARNVSAVNADRVVITDPIPKQMEYVAGSAESAAGQLLFSVDGGFRFDRPENLTVATQDGASRPAVASDYTHLRWVFAAPLAPAELRSVRFLAKLE